VQRTAALRGNPAVLPHRVGPGRSDSGLHAARGSTRIEETQHRVPTARRIGARRTTAFQGGRETLQSVPGKQPPKKHGRAASSLTWEDN